MKILFVLGKYLPEKTGGIENYCHWLASILLQNKFEVNAAILNSSDMEPYSHEGIEVIPLKKGFASFTSLLEKKNYEIIHFHEYSGCNGINIEWFKIAKNYCKKLFFTFHLPYLTCYKNDFRYMGIEDCNDFTNSERCTKCIISTKLKYQRNQHFNLYNLGINLLIPLIKRTNRINKLNDRIQSRKDEMNELISICNNIFIYGAWFKELLTKNGYTSDVLKKIPHITKITSKDTEQSDGNIKNKIVFVGRIEKQKGLHLLCKAMNNISTNGIQLDVYGNIVDEEYYLNCKSEYVFNYNGAISRRALLELLPSYDFLILPSVFTEMYSLILREAFYEKLPVIVSAAKGNKDVVHNGINGFVFEYDNPSDLSKKIDEAYQLKEGGWQPSSLVASNSESEISEIISYYK